MKNRNEAFRLAVKNARRQLLILLESRLGADLRWHLLRARILEIFGRTGLEALCANDEDLHDGIATAWHKIEVLLQSALGNDPQWRFFAEQLSEIFKTSRLESFCDHNFDDLKDRSGNRGIKSANH